MKFTILDVVVDLSIVKWVVGGFYTLLLMLIGAIVKNTLSRIEKLENAPVASKADVVKLEQHIDKLEMSGQLNEKELVKLNSKIDLMVENQRAAAKTNEKLEVLLGEVKSALLRKNIL
jgi:predicted  nucleic acid-binding Zn-ribbon protein